MSPQPRIAEAGAARPITNYLADFGGQAAAPPAPPPMAQPAAPMRERQHVAANAEDDARARAFAEGKEEGIKLAEARHALEQRRREGEDARRTAASVLEAEARVGALLAERLSQEIATIERRLSADLATTVQPFLRASAERSAVEALAREATRLRGIGGWRLSGPRRLTDAFLDALPPDLRERATCREIDGMDLVLEVDEARLSTRLGELADALGAM